MNKQVWAFIDTLKEIRDLARTGTAPTAFNLTEDEWNKHKLTRIVQLVNKVLPERKNV